MSFARRDPRRPGRQRLAAALLLGALLAGCTAGRADVNRLPPGLILVVPRGADADNRPIAVEAADALIGVLRNHADVVSSRDFLRQAQAQVLGPAPRVGRLLARVEHGGWPDAVDVAEILEPGGVTMVLTVSVSASEQVWASVQKLTRVRLEAQAFSLRGRDVAWTSRGSAEVDGERGRAFRLALEHAVLDLADAIRPGSAPSSYRPVVRGLWPWTGSLAW